MLQRELRAQPCRVAWAAPDTMHLTLLFLGDILPEAVPGLAQALDGVGAATAPFLFSVDEIGTFGPPRSPRVVWCGVRDGRREVVTLQAAVATAARGLGFFWSDTREYSPHVTLGRVKSSTGAGTLMKVLSSHAHDRFGSTHATQLQLMRSRLSPSGAAHTLLHASPFRTR